MIWVIGAWVVLAVLVVLSWEQRRLAGKTVIEQIERGSDRQLKRVLLDLNKWERAGYSDVVGYNIKECRAAVKAELKKRGLG